MTSLSFFYRAMRPHAQSRLCLRGGECCFSWLWQTQRGHIRPLPWKEAVGSAELLEKSLMGLL